jgi:hypothetical protein
LKKSNESATFFCENFRSFLRRKKSRPAVNQPIKLPGKILSRPAVLIGQIPFPSARWGGAISSSALGKNREIPGKIKPSDRT